MNAQDAEVKSPRLSMSTAEQLIARIDEITDDQLQNIAMAGNLELMRVFVHSAVNQGVLYGYSAAIKETREILDGQIEED